MFLRLAVEAADKYSGGKSGGLAVCFDIWLVTFSKECQLWMWGRTKQAQNPSAETTPLLYWWIVRWKIQRAAKWGIRAGTAEWQRKAAGERSEMRKLSINILFLLTTGTHVFLPENNPKKGPLKQFVSSWHHLFEMELYWLLQVQLSITFGDQL